MLVFAAESACGAVVLSTASAERLQAWQTIGLYLKAFIPGVWLAFSLAYARGDYREFLRKSKALLLAAFLLPLPAALIFTNGALRCRRTAPVAPSGSNSALIAKVLNALLLVASILILMNFERTFRAAVGTMQWRIKFVILGLAVIFGARIYARTQMLLFSGYELGLINVEGGALLIGCALMAVGYLRTGFGEIDVYPSRAVLHTSFTVLLAGGYLFVVGVLAQLVARRVNQAISACRRSSFWSRLAFSRYCSSPTAFDRRPQLFISRHFRRPQHDFREIWTQFTASISTALHEPEICAASVRSISSTFNALSVSVWLFEGASVINSFSPRRPRNPRLPHADGKR